MSKLHLLVGTISMDGEKLQKLFASMEKISIQNIQIDFLIFANNPRYIKPTCKLSSSNINYILLEKKLSLDIPEARNFLYHNILAYCHSQKINPILWLLDEDIEIDSRANDYLPSLIQLKKQKNIDVLIGSLEGDSPNSAFSGMQLQLFDLIENLKWLNSLNQTDTLPNRKQQNEKLRKKYPDYYYDLTARHTGHLHQTFWIEPKHRNETVEEAKERLYIGLNNILIGKNIFRPLKQNKTKSFEDCLFMGANTFVFNLDTLKVKNPTIKINGENVRRSEMLWTLINQELCNKKIVSGNFPVLHNRQESTEQELSLNKTLKDIRGSLIFNALKKYFDQEETNFYESVQIQANEKTRAVTNSFEKILSYIEALEKIDNPEIIKFCQQLRTFYTSDNLVLMNLGIKQFETNKEEILKQFKCSLPLIRSVCDLKNKYGKFKQYDIGDNAIKILSKTAIEKMDKNIPPLVRIHSSCCNSEVFGATDCDCASQLDAAMEVINYHGSGIIFYLDQEGRGHGYGKKIAIVEKMQSKNINTYQACENLGIKKDVRNYKPVANLLKEMGFEKIRLLSNNATKQKDLTQYGIKVVQVPLLGLCGQDNIAYLLSKQEKAGHQNLIITEQQIVERYPKNTDCINFCQVEGEYGAFSNFADYPFVINDTYWRTSEHYYQAQKFNNSPDIAKKIQTAKTPALAKSIAWNNLQAVDINWENKKIPFMYNALYKKLSQNEEIRDLLLSTGEKYIIEVSKNDEYWGHNKNGYGKNILGKLLMYLRDQFRLLETPHTLDSYKINIKTLGKNLNQESNFWMFHRVTINDNKISTLYNKSGMTHTFEEIISLIDTAIKEGRKFGSIKQALNNTEIIHLTFDDGYKEHLIVAKKLKEKYGFSPECITFSINVRNSFYFEKFSMDMIYKLIDDNRVDELNKILKIDLTNVTDINDIKNEICDSTEYISALNALDIDVSDCFLNDAEVIELSKLFSIASHCINHCYLTTLTEENAIFELRKSKEFLEDRLGLSIETICYPDGKNNEYIRGLSESCGYKYGLSLRGGKSRYQIGRKIA